MRDIFLYACFEFILFSTGTLFCNQMYFLNVINFMIETHYNSYKYLCVKKKSSIKLVT